MRKHPCQSRSSHNPHLATEGCVSINRFVGYAIPFVVVLVAACAMAEDECYSDSDCGDGNACMSDECKLPSPQSLSL